MENLWPMFWYKTTWRNLHFRRMSRWSLLLGGTILSWNNLISTSCGFLSWRKLAGSKWTYASGFSSRRTEWTADRNSEPIRWRRWPSRGRRPTSPSNTWTTIIYGSLDSMKTSETADGGASGKNNRRRRRRSSQKQQTARRPEFPCSFFVDGKCCRPDCKFSHDLGSITFKFWMESSCFKGIYNLELCDFLN